MRIDSVGNWLNRKSKPSQRQQRTLRPSLELLEERMVPSTVAADWRQQNGDPGWTKYSAGDIPAEVAPHLEYNKRFYTAYVYGGSGFFVHMYANNIAVANGQAVVFSNDVPYTPYYDSVLEPLQVTRFDWATGVTEAKYDQPYAKGENPYELDSHHYTTPVIWHTDGRIYSRRGGDGNGTFSLDPNAGTWTMIAGDPAPDESAYLQLYGDDALYSQGEYFGKMSTYDISAAAYASGNVFQNIKTMSGPVALDTPKVARNIAVVYGGLDGYGYGLGAYDIDTGVWQWWKTIEPGQVQLINEVVPDPHSLIVTEDGLCAYVDETNAVRDLHVLDLETGEEKWSQVLDNNYLHTPVLAYHGGYLYAVDGLEQFKFNANSGAVVWHTSNTSGFGNAHAVLTDDTLWVGYTGDAGTACLVGIRTADGTITQSVDLYALDGAKTVDDLAAADGMLGVLAEPDVPYFASLAAAYNASYQDCLVFSFPTGGNQPPTVATAAHVTGNSPTTTGLSVLGADDGGEANLTYTWAEISGPAGVSFNANGSNAAKNTTATFAQAGSYSFRVTITDAGGLSTTSTVSVTVNQTLTSIAVAPGAVTLTDGATQQFTGTAMDQFGNALSTQPAFTWSVVSGSGTISSSGLYTAPASGTGSATVGAAIGSVNGTASVTVAVSTGAWTSLGGHVSADVLTQPIAVAANADGRLSAFAIGTEHAVWVKTQTAPNGSWGAWTYLGGWVSSISVCTNADGRLELFVIGGEHAVWTMSQTAPSGGWGSWVLLGGHVSDDALTEPIPVARNTDGRLEIFAIGTEHAAWTMTQTAANGGWVANSWMNLGGWVSSISVGTNADGRLELFVIGGEHAVWTMSQTAPSGGWGFWLLLGGHVSDDALTEPIPVARNADGRLEIFAIGTEHAAWTMTQTAANGGWVTNSWTYLGGWVSEISVGTNADGRLALYVIGGDHAVYTMSQTAPSGGWVSGSWLDLGNSVTSISVGTNANGQLELFATGSDTAVWTLLP
jgi:hypothetical protein